MRRGGGQQQPKPFQYHKHKQYVPIAVYTHAGPCVRQAQADTSSKLARGSTEDVGDDSATVTSPARAPQVRVRGAVGYCSQLHQCATRLKNLGVNNFRLGLS